MFPRALIDLLLLLLLCLDAGAYNVLMGAVLSEMSKGHGFSTLLQQGDTTKWFDLAAWFTGYVRAQQVTRLSRMELPRSVGFARARPLYVCLPVLQHSSTGTARTACCSIGYSDVIKCDVSDHSCLSHCTALYCTVLHCTAGGAV
jgi:hypothetical protein